MDTTENHNGIRTEAKIHRIGAFFGSQVVMLPSGFGKKRQKHSKRKGLSSKHDFSGVHVNFRVYVHSKKLDYDGMISKFGHHHPPFLRACTVGKLSFFLKAFSSKDAKGSMKKRKMKVALESRILKSVLVMGKNVFHLESS